MTRTRQHIRTRLEALGLPGAVLEIYDGRSPHAALTDVCAAPERILACCPENRADVIPLWETGALVTARDVQRDVFILFSLEAPEEEDILGASFDGVAARVILALWENDEEEGALRSVADLLQFTRIDAFIDGIEQTDLQSRDAYDAWISDFLQSC